MKKIDLTGKRFGRLTVIGESGHVGNRICWRCRCDCGNVKDILGEHLRSGRIVSCGCYHSEIVIERNTTHGKTGTKLFNIWMAIKNKCLTSSSPKFPKYGGVGISIFDEWISENGFNNFMIWAYSSGYEEGMQLFRKDGNKDFCPDNCYFKFVRKRNLKNIEFNKQLIIDGEEWRNIDELNGYMISNFGRIKSVERKNKLGKRIKERIITPYINTKDGYLRKNFEVNGKFKRLLVHRMVAKAFIPNPYNFPIVNHKDENKLNNHVENLEWCDQSYNAKYSIEKNGYHKKRVIMMNECGNVVEIYESLEEARKAVGLKDSSGISACCKGKKLIAGGHRWKYADF